MLSSLWMLAVVLLYSVYQQTFETCLLSERPTSPLSDDLSSLHTQLLRKRIEQSPSFISEDDKGFSSRIACEKNTQRERIFELLASIKEKSSCCERMTKQNCNEIHSNRSTTNSKGNEKKIRKLYECVSDEIQVNIDTDEYQATPYVLSLGQNKIVVLWYTTDDLLNITGRLFDLSLNPLSDEFKVTTRTDTNELSHAILLPSGYYAVFWRNDNSVFFAIMNDDSVVQSATKVNTSNSNKIRYPGLCSSVNGGFLVYWNQQKSGHYVQGRLFDGSANPQGDDFEIAFSDKFITHIRCSTLENGHFVVIWSQKIENSIFKLLAQIIDSSGTPIGDTFNSLNTYTASYYIWSSVAILSDGNLVIAWDTYEGSITTMDIYAQIYDSTVNPIGDKFLVNTYTYVSQAKPDIEVLHDGGFLISWVSQIQDGSSYGVYAQRYNAFASRIDEEFLINIWTESSQMGQNVAAIDNGFIVVWESSEQDGDEDGVFMRAFYDFNTFEDCRASSYGGCWACPFYCVSCDSYGCLSCPPGQNCCSLPRFFNSESNMCEDCRTWDNMGCLTCPPGVTTCCPYSRYFDSDFNTCEECGTWDNIGCLTCPSGVSMCCPDGKFFDSTTETCEECISPCETCNSLTECTTCESGSTCCGDGRYSDSNRVCQDCLSDCAACSDGSSCDVCRDPDVTAPECCPDSTQDDSNKDGYCECLEGNTSISSCQCQPDEQWYWDGTSYSCIGPVDASSPLTIESISEIGSSCYENLEMLVTDFSDVPNNEDNPIKFRWFSDSSSLAGYLRGQVSNPLSVPSADLPSGTTIFTVYMSVYGVVHSGTFSVTKSEDIPLTVSLSHGSLTILSSDETAVVTASVSSQPCPSVAYNWTSISSQSLQLPDSSSDTLLIPSNTLPIDTHSFYTFSASSGSASFTQSLIFYVASSDLAAVIDPVGPYVSSSEDLILNGKSSFDTSDNSESLRFFWSCEEIECGSCPYLPVITKSRLRISSIELSSGMSFTIVLTVYKDDRSASASVRLSVV